VPLRVGDRTERVSEALVIVAVLVTIPLTWIQLRGADSALVRTIDWAVWAVFAFDLAVVLLLRRQGTRVTGARLVMDTTIVVLSFPALPAVLALARLARLARLSRLLRLLRLVSVTARGLGALKATLGQRGLIYTVSVVTVLVFAGGATLSALEPETVPGGFWTGVWWAIVTATTVGYGDVSPVTGPGRIVAVVLMLGGVGLVATLAAAVAARFVGQQEESEMTEIRGRLERIETLLEEMAARSESGSLHR